MSSQDYAELKILPVTANQEWAQSTVTPAVLPFFSEENSEEFLFGINQVPCGKRKDWYRVIDTLTNPNPAKYKTYCFANDGEIHLKHAVAADTLFPGNNVGSGLWTNGATGILDTFKWSVPRSGKGDYDTCYKFDRTIYVSAVRLNR